MSDVGVKNLADPQQVQKASDRAGLVRRQEMDDLRAVLDTAAGRRLMWRILTFCKVFESVFHASALIHYQSGQQDVGHWLMGEATTADQDKFLLMMTEAKPK